MATVSVSVVERLQLSPLSTATDELEGSIQLDSGFSESSMSSNKEPTESAKKVAKKESVPVVERVQLSPLSTATDELEVSVQLDSGFSESSMRSNKEPTESANKVKTMEESQNLTGEDLQVLGKGVHQMEHDTTINTQISNVDAKENTTDIVIPGAHIIGMIHDLDRGNDHESKEKIPSSDDVVHVKIPLGEDNRWPTDLFVLSNPCRSTFLPDSAPIFLPSYDACPPRPPPLGPVTPLLPAPFVSPSSHISESPPPNLPSSHISKPPPPNPPPLDISTTQPPCMLSLSPQEKCPTKKESVPVQEMADLVVANPSALTQEEVTLTRQTNEGDSTAGTPTSESEPPTPNEVADAISDLGSHEVHLFWEILDRDVKIAEGGYKYDCSCSCCTCGDTKCVMGYRVNAIKRESVKGGSKVAAIQWNDRKKPYVSLLFKSIKLIVSLLLFGVTMRKAVNHVYRDQTVKTGQIVFDAICAFISAIESILSLVLLIVFLSRRLPELIAGWKCFLLCANDLCTSERITLTCCCCCCCHYYNCECCSCHNRRTRQITRSVKDRMKGSKCCGLWCTTLQYLNRLQTRRGRVCTIVGNFSEIILTVVSEIMATVVFVLKLYTFIGQQKYRAFYQAHPEFSEVEDLLAIVFSSIILLISHGVRFISIASNIYDFDKDILNVPQFTDKLKCCQRAFSFQSRLVMHSLLLSLLQIVCLFALAWKIIRDQCFSLQEFYSDNSEHPTGLYGQLTICSLPTPAEPHTVNGYTVYSILYITIFLPIMSHLFLFVSNVAFVVEYCQLLYASGLYKFEKAVEESDEKQIEEGVPHSRLSEILCVFFSLLRPNEISKDELRKKKDEIGELRRKIQEDVLSGDYAGLGKKFGALFSFPFASVVGIIHIAFFMVYLGFLACRYSPLHEVVFCTSPFGYLSCPYPRSSAVLCASGMDNFSVFSPSDVALEETVFVLFLLILFFLTGIPGHIITIACIVAFAFIVALMAIIFFFVSACPLLAIFAVCILYNNESVQRVLQLGPM